MLLQEFIDRTRFCPSAEEYRKIEEAYNDFDGDKDKFCAYWKRHKGILVTSFRMSKKISEQKITISTLKRNIENYAEELAKLKSELRAARALNEEIRSKIQSIL